MHRYVLKCYIYEGAKYDKSSCIDGAGYDVFYRLMEMGKLLDNSYHLFPDNLFIKSNETKSATAYTKRNCYC